MGTKAGVEGPSRKVGAIDDSTLSSHSIDKWGGPRKPNGQFGPLGVVSPLLNFNLRKIKNGGAQKYVLLFSTPA